MNEKALQTTENQAQLAANLADYQQAAQGAFSDATEQARRSDWRVFMSWCESADVSPLPCSASDLAAFVDALSSDRAVSTLRRYISTISTAHKAAGIEPNPATSETVRLALRRVARAKGTRQKQARGLTWNEIQLALSALGDSPRDARDKAMLAVAYDTLCRRSELVALQVQDLEYSPDGSATVLVRRSKTDQEGAGQLRYLAPTTVDLVKAWLSASGLEAGALFRGMNNGHAVNTALSTRGVNRAFHRVAKKTGLELDGISGHSCRVGAAQDMVAANVDLASVMQAGGWKSAAMPARYSEHLQARRSGMAKLAAIQGR